MHAQPPERRCAHTAGKVDLRNRRVGQRQIDPGARRTSRKHAPTGRRGAQAEVNEVARLRANQGMGEGGKGAGSGPDADRQDAAFLPGDLRRILGRDPETVRGDHRSAHARLRAHPIFV